MNKNTGQDLMIMMASFSSKEELVERTKQAISEWESNPNDKTWNHLGFTAIMLSTKGIFEKEDGNADELKNKLDRFEKARKGAELLDRTDN